MSAARNLSVALLFLLVQLSWLLNHARCEEVFTGPAIPRQNILRIGLMQAMPEASDQALNLKKAEKYCRQAAQQEVDLLLMPEMWNIGYRGFNVFDEPTTKKWQSQAIATDGPWVQHFCKLAQELEMAIALTFLQQWKDKPRNVVSIIDSNGDILLTYAKVHTCDFSFEAALTPGDQWHVVDFEFRGKSLKLGTMICFDREFPESARSLMLAGAEVIIVPNACLLDSIRLAQFQVRAYENSVAMAMANYAEPQNNGHSIVVDPSGTIIYQAEKQEGLFFADIDLDSLRDWRKRSLWGNAWRRPSQYSKLTQKEELDVFQRKNAYGQDFEP